MAKTNINNLKNWFKNGLKPTQEHFWNWLDSFWHKDDKIPLSSIESMEDRFSEKADAEALDNHIKDENAHGLVDKLSLKTDNTVFENHLNDENAHGLSDKLATKVDVSWATEISDRLDTHIEDDNAHGLVDKLVGKADKDHKHEISDVIGLTEALADAGKVKTVNDIAPDENGNIEVSVEDNSKLPLDGSKPMEGPLILNKGTTTQAPLNLPKGELLTVPIDGTIERDKNGKLYNTVGSNRYEIYDSSMPMFRTVFTGFIHSYRNPASVKSDVFRATSPSSGYIRIPKGVFQKRNKYMLPMLINSGTSVVTISGKTYPIKVIHRVELVIKDGYFINRDNKFFSIELYKREFNNITDMTSKNPSVSSCLTMFETFETSTGFETWSKLYIEGKSIDVNGVVTAITYPELESVYSPEKTVNRGNVLLKDVDIDIDIPVVHYDII